MVPFGGGGGGVGPELMEIEERSGRWGLSSVRPGRR